MDENLEDCDGAGVLSTVAGTIGVLMANTAIKAIIGNETYESMLFKLNQRNWPHFFQE